MSRVPYPWTTDDDEVALDAVTVGIGSDGEALIAAGMTAEPVTASVYWPEHLFQGDKVDARMEGPFDPAVALDYAAVIAERYGFGCVVVSLQDRSLWDNAWGTLQAIEGLNG